MPEAHVVLIWERALDQADRILADLASRFSIRDVARVTWTPARFAENLTRFYGTALLSGSEKERECGTGQFLVAALVDDDPRYARRRHTRGRMLVNTRLFAAKERYRSWAGGSHRVHATLTAREGSKDLFLLLERTAADVLASPTWGGAIRERRADLTGAGGWRDADRLVGALDATVGTVVLPKEDGRLRLLVDDLWWAVRIADPGADDEAPERLVEIGGRPTPLRLLTPGDGSLDPAWQEQLLTAAVRDERGWPVPGPVDRFYLALAADRPAVLTELEGLAAAHSLPRGDYANPAFAAAAVAAYVEALGEQPAASLARRLLRRRRS